MNRQLPGMLLTAFAFCISISCSDKSASGPSGLALNDSTATESRVASATVTLAQASLEVGQTTQATALLLDRYNNPLSLAVVWSTSDSSLATVSGSGLVRARSPGSASIVATRGYKSGAATLTVVASSSTTPVPVASVSVSPASSTLQIGATVQLQVSDFDAGNNVLTGRVVTSSSASPAIASVNSLGLVTAVSIGTTQITVTSEGKSAVATIIVSASAPPPTNPSTVTDLKATVTGSTSVTLSFTQVNDGTGQPAKYDVRYAVAPISWGSATSTTSGTCTTPVAGTATGGQLSCTVLGLTAATNYNFQLIAFRGTMNLNAVYGSLSNTVSATTTTSGAPPPVPVASVSVTPASSTLQVGATVQLQVTERDANNNVLTGRVVTSSSAAPGIASVNSLGLVTAISAGSTQITVTSEGKSANATIIVSAAAPAPVATVSVTPTSSSLQLGATAQLSAVTRDASNNTLTGRLIAWSSSNPAVSTVSASGLVTANAAGSATITALSETKIGTAAITVTAVVAPPPGTAEPTGMTTITERPFSAISEGGWGIVAASGSTSNFSIVSDGLAPKSPLTVGQILFPAGFSGGGEPVNVYTVLGSQYRTLYLGIWLKMSSNWQGHPTSVNKMIHLYTGGSNHVVPTIWGSGNGMLQAGVLMQGIVTDGTGKSAVNLYPNLGHTGEIVRGRWHHLEYVFVGNTSGTANASAEWWLDGVKVGSYTSMQYVSGNSVWEQLSWAPTWGGLGSTVTSTMTMSFDHIRVSGKN